MSWLRRIVCRLFNLVTWERFSYVSDCLAAVSLDREALRHEIQKTKLLNDPREHVSRECYAQLEERYDVLFREHQVLKEKANASDDETVTQSARIHRAT